VPVAESNLNSNIFALRQTLGKDEQGQDYITTVARRGYRFAASVRVVAPNDSDQQCACGQPSDNVRPVHADAYQLYLQGHACWQQRTAEGLQQAIAYFSRAIALD
jgi:DNA-binding winged helix-turn-helix (wHTH) protein